MNWNEAIFQISKAKKIWETFAATKVCLSKEKQFEFHF